MGCIAMGRHGVGRIWRSWVDPAAIWPHEPAILACTFKEALSLDGAIILANHIVVLNSNPEARGDRLYPAYVAHFCPPLTQSGCSRDNDPIANLTTKHRASKVKVKGGFVGMV